MAATMTEQEMWDELCAADDERVAAWLADEDEGDEHPDADKPQYACGRNVWYRVQPAGLPVVGHTSMGSEYELLPGFVFAYGSADELMAGQMGWGIYGDEVVSFTGSVYYDAGDAEGFAVAARTELRRWTIQEFAAKRRGETARRFRTYLAGE